MIEQGLASALMDAAVDAIIVIDDKGIIQQFSESATVLFGYAPEEVLGNNVSML
ncbi:MAG TPA: PAS domain-containing sensor histidine kinase, partial [Marinobacter adhaerens]|nr:PAS domain-containing sensor histidine kinase [Marinobacter adhaerens]